MKHASLGRFIVFGFLFPPAWFYHEMSEGAEDISSCLFLGVCFSHTLHTPTGSWFVRNRDDRISGQVTGRLQSLEEALGWTGMGFCLLTAVGTLCLSAAWLGLSTASCPSLPQAVFPWALNPQALFCSLWGCCASLSPTPFKVLSAWRLIKEKVSDYLREEWPQLPYFFAFA